MAYDKYNSHEMSDYIPSDEELQAAFAQLTKI
jgi:hypothetical protein